MNELYLQVTPYINEIDLLLIHALSTCYMAGLIWFVQLVHYPLFKRVGEESHLRYHSAHVYWTAWAVGPPMIIEALTTALLCLSPNFPSELTYGGALCLAVIWLSTALIQVPCHDHLSRGFTEDIHRRLVRSNWIRCVGWSVRALTSLALLKSLMPLSSP